MASSDELNAYNTDVVPLQDQVFFAAAEFGEDLVLTGPTALSRAYEPHRITMTLDLSARRGDVRAIAFELAGNISSDVLVGQGSPGFACFWVSKGDQRLRVNVASDDMRLERARRWDTFGLFVHSLRDIAANKLSSFEDYSSVLDAIDLYFLFEKIGFDQVFTDSNQKNCEPDYDELYKIASEPLRGEALLRQEPIFLEAFITNFRVRLIDVMRAKMEAILEANEAPQLIKQLLSRMAFEDRHLKLGVRDLLVKRALQADIITRDAVLTYLDEPRLLL